jgi:hypothetical protein
VVRKRASHLRDKHLTPMGFFAVLFLSTNKSTNKFSTVKFGEEIVLGCLPLLATQ